MERLKKFVDAILECHSRTNTCVVTINISDVDFALFSDAWGISPSDYVKKRDREKKQQEIVAAAVNGKLLVSMWPDDTAFIDDRAACLKKMCEDQGEAAIDERIAEIVNSLLDAHKVTTAVRLVSKVDAIHLVRDQAAPAFLRLFSILRANPSIYNDSFG